jgi:hypothetical protein
MVYRTPTISFLERAGAGLITDILFEFINTGHASSKRKLGYCIEIHTC